MRLGSKYVKIILTQIYRDCFHSYSTNTVFANDCIWWWKMSLIRIGELAVDHLNRLLVSELKKFYILKVWVFKNAYFPFV